MATSDSPDAPMRPGRIPPHSEEAERGVLGSALLDAHRVVDLCIAKQLSPESFYAPAHRVLFEHVTQMYNDGRPIDLLTVTQRLKDLGVLDQVGGDAYVERLIASTPTDAHAEYYIDIVRQKHLLRTIIDNSRDAIESCYSGDEDADIILDTAEQALYDISNFQRAAVIPWSEAIKEQMTTIEKIIQEKREVTGVSTGYLDIDKITRGFQPGDMIIIAARPSMGKCLSFDSEIVLGDGSVETIETIHRRKRADLFTLASDWRFTRTSPSAYVDDGHKPVFRVTTRLGRSVESTASHPFLTVRGWTKLADLRPGEKIAVPRRMPVFGAEAMRECEIKLMAYLIGDGSLTGALPGFTNRNPRLLRDFEEACAEFGGLSVRAHDVRGTRAPTLRVSKDGHLVQRNRLEFGARLRAHLAFSGRPARSVAQALGVSPASVCEWSRGRRVPGPGMVERISNELGVEPCRLMPAEATDARKNDRSPLARWLDDLGLNGLGSKAKFVPPAIFKLPRKQMALFLNRLFATDGWATVLASGQAQAGYATTSERLARQVQHLLLRFGVIASLRKRAVKYDGGRRTSWQLDITGGESLEILASEIGVFGKESSVDGVLQAVRGSGRKANRDLIPRDIWNAVAASKGEESWSSLGRRAGLAGASNLHVGTRELSRPRLAALAGALDDDSLRTLAASDVYWDEIVSIEPAGVKQVYDLTIPGTHNFVANDLCVHNTSLAMNIAENVAIGNTWDKAPKPVAIFSLEMSRESLVRRMLCSRAGVPSHKLSGGYISNDLHSQLVRAADELGQAKIYVDDSAGLSAIEVRARARRLKRKYGIEMIVIDYLQMMNYPQFGKEGRQRETAAISGAMKAMAKELRIPVVVLSQLSRAPEQRDKTAVPKLSDLRDSGSIEQDADVVCMLRRPCKYPEDEEFNDKTLAILDVAKHRNGPTGEIRLNFIDELTRFENRAEGVDRRESFAPSHGSV